MWKAIQNKDGDALKIALENGANPAAEDGLGNFPIHYLADEPELVKILVEHGGDINGYDYYYCVPLVNCNKPENVQALIDMGADVNKLDENGASLFMAAMDGHKRDICEVLIKNGANINLRDRWGQTAYTYAAKKGFRDMCEWYLSIGGEK